MAQNFGNTGIMNQRSTFATVLVRDGMSNTLMVGEKYLDPDHYNTGFVPSDDQSMYCGWPTGKTAGRSTPASFEQVAQFPGALGF